MNLKGEIYTNGFAWFCSRSHFDTKARDNSSIAYCDVPERVHKIVLKVGLADPAS